MRALVAALLLLASCANISAPHYKTVPFTDAGKNPCETTKVWPSWYSAETLTTCVQEGKVVEMHTNHSDMSMVAAMLGALGALSAL